MCFYFQQTKDAQTVEKRFRAKLTQPSEFSPSELYNAFDYPKTPLITEKQPELIEMGNWGLIPEWSTPDWNRNFTLNARIETLNEKPAFRDAVENRCLIILDSFFEWQHSGKQKIKYKIGFNGELFALAGIYTQYENQLYYSIITTEAEGIMREIHNTKFRMPLALKTDEDFEKWLNSGESKPAIDFTAQPLSDFQTSLFD